MQNELKLKITSETLLNVIKYEKLISLQHRVRAIKSHIQNSTNHCSGTMWSHCTYNPWRDPQCVTS